MIDKNFIFVENNWIPRKTKAFDFPVMLKYMDGECDLF